MKYIYIWDYGDHQLRLKCAQVRHQSPAGTFARVPGRCLRWSPTPPGPRWSPAYRYILIEVLHLYRCVTHTHAKKTSMPISAPVRGICTHIYEQPNPKLWHKIPDTWTIGAKKISMVYILCLQLVTTPCHEQYCALPQKVGKWEGLYYFD